MNPSNTLVRHEFVELIESFIRSGNLAPEEVREDAVDSIKYAFRTVTGLGVAICIYLDGDGESFIWIESIIGRTEPNCEHAILKRIAEMNHDFFFPLRIATNPNGYVCLQLRGFAAGFTKEQIRVRLESLAPISEKVREELRRLGLNVRADDLH